jgi:hypothetical protein
MTLSYEQDAHDIATEDYEGETGSLIAFGLVVFGALALATFTILAVLASVLR